jgi:hypothetical protein
MELNMWLVILLIILTAALIFIKSTGREYFTVAKRTGLLCKPLLNNHTENDLMPKPYISIVIQGYNYQKTPIIYRDGKKITPLQYEWDYMSMAYYFVVWAPNKKCGSEWILETSDFVKPVVTDGVTNVDFKVELERRREGYNKWRLLC